MAGGLGKEHGGRRMGEFIVQIIDRWFERNEEIYK